MKIYLSCRGLKDHLTSSILGPTFIKHGVRISAVDAITNLIEIKNQHFLYAYFIRIRDNIWNENSHVIKSPFLPRNSPNGQWNFFFSVKFYSIRAKCLVHSTWWFLWFLPHDLFGELRLMIFLMNSAWWFVWRIPPDDLFGKFHLMVCLVNFAWWFLWWIPPDGLFGEYHLIWWFVWKEFYLMIFKVNSTW